MFKPLNLLVRETQDRRVSSKQLSTLFPPFLSAAKTFCQMQTLHPALQTGLLCLLAVQTTVVIIVYAQFSRLCHIVCEIVVTAAQATGTVSD
jgi:hypothetical protein